MVNLIGKNKPDRVLVTYRRVQYEINLARCQRALVRCQIEGRVASMAEAGQLILDGAPILWMFWIKDAWPYRKAVKNFQYNGFYTTWAVRIYDLYKDA